MPRPRKGAGGALREAGAVAKKGAGAATRGAVAGRSPHALLRFGVAMEEDLLARFDRLVERRGHANRSEALRDLVRRELDRDAWATGGRVVATVTLVYDHHVRELTERLTEIQHEFGDRIVSTLHVHLDHDHCMEVIAARGPAPDIRSLAERLLGAKGVLGGDVTAAAVPESHHGHGHGAHFDHAHGHVHGEPPKQGGGRRRGTRSSR